MANNIEEIILGSGDVYVTEFTDTIPADTTLEVDANLIGRIQGGASIEYKPTYYTAKDDKGVVSKTIITDEEATFKTGVITWNGDTLSKLSATGRTTTDSTTGTVTTKIGGIGNDNGKKYLIRFVHSDPQEGTKRVTIVGKNEAGFTLSFAKDKETVVDAEFKANPMDSDGTLIEFKETPA